MKPYYEADGITLYHGDCREILPELGLQADCIVADEPYGETSIPWDRRLKWAGLADTILKPNGTLWRFGSMRMFLETSAEWADWLFVQDVVWEKHNGSACANDRFMRVHENALQFRRKGASWSDVFKSPQRVGGYPRSGKVLKRGTKPAHFGGIDGEKSGYTYGDTRLQRSVIYENSCQGYAIHPTQKPTGIVRPLVAYSCPPGGLCVDPFAGSGTTLEVCRELGMRCVATEGQEEYCEKIAIRLSQGLLFGEAA